MYCIFTVMIYNQIMNIYYCHFQERWESIRCPVAFRNGDRASPGRESKAAKEPTDGWYGRPTTSEKFQDLQSHSQATKKNHRYIVCIYTYIYDTYIRMIYIYMCMLGIYSLCMLCIYICMININIEIYHM